MSHHLMIRGLSGAWTSSWQYESTLELHWPRKMPHHSFGASPSSCSFSKKSSNAYQWNSGLFKQSLTKVYSHGTSYKLYAFFEILNFLTMSNGAVVVLFEAMQEDNLRNFAFLTKRFHKRVFHCCDFNGRFIAAQIFLRRPVSFLYTLPFTLPWIF